MSATLQSPPDAPNQAGSLYDRDFHAWTAEQARLLRSAQFGRVDVQNVAEEIEDLGASLRRELKNRIRTLVEHLLKLEFSASREPVRGWMETVRRTRVEIQETIEESPSLAGVRGQMLSQVQDSAGRLAAESLGTAGEDSAGIIARMKSGGLTEDEVFGTSMPDGPSRRHGA